MWCHQRARIFSNMRSRDPFARYSQYLCSISQDHILQDTPITTSTTTNPLPFLHQLPHHHKLFRGHYLSENFSLFQKSVNLDECDATYFVTVVLEEVLFNTNTFSKRSQFYSFGCSKCSVVFIEDIRLD